jgi:hypothetical protein
MKKISFLLIAWFALVAINTTSGAQENRAQLRFSEFSCVKDATPLDNCVTLTPTGTTSLLCQIFPQLIQPI